MAEGKKKKKRQESMASISAWVARSISLKQGRPVMMISCHMWWKALAMTPTSS